MDILYVKNLVNKCNELNTLEQKIDSETKEELKEALYFLEDEQLKELDGETGMQVETLKKVILKLLKLQNTPQRADKSLIVDRDTYNAIDAQRDDGETFGQAVRRLVKRAGWFNTGEVDVITPDHVKERR